MTERNENEIAQGDTLGEWLRKPDGDLNPGAARRLAESIPSTCNEGISFAQLRDALERGPIIGYDVLNGVVTLRVLESR